MQFIVNNGKKYPIVINIQNISDIITNSSSEVFICKSENAQETVDLMSEILTSVYDNFKKARDISGRNTYSYWGDSLDDILTISIADSDYHDDSYNYSYKKGDILVESTCDNSIPEIIMDFIYEFFAFDKIQRVHLG